MARAIPRRTSTRSDWIKDQTQQVMETYLDFIGNHLVLVSALMISFFVLVFTELQRKASGVSNLDPTEAVKLINADATVVDLRNADAFARGHIVNAKNIPSDELDDELDKIKRLGDKPIVAVCDAGMSSSKLVNRLRKAGIENVYGLKGGINALPAVIAKRSSALLRRFNCPGSVSSCVFMKKSWIGGMFSHVPTGPRIIRVK